MFTVICKIFASSLLLNLCLDLKTRGCTAHILGAGRAIGKGFYFQDIGIKNGLNFHNFGIRNGTDLQDFTMKYKVRYTFSKNWYKFGYTFQKIGKGTGMFLKPRWQVHGQNLLKCTHRALKTLSSISI